MAVRLTNVVTGYCTSVIAPFDSRKLSTHSDLKSKPLPRRTARSFRARTALYNRLGLVRARRAASRAVN